MLTSAVFPSPESEMLRPIKSPEDSLAMSWPRSLQAIFEVIDVHVFCVHGCHVVSCRYHGSNVAVFREATAFPAPSDTDLFSTWNPLTRHVQKISTPQHRKGRRVETIKPWVSPSLQWNRRLNNPQTSLELFIIRSRSAIGKRAYSLVFRSNGRLWCW